MSAAPPPEGSRTEARQAAWADAPERSNLLALRFIVGMALWLGRPLTRLLLHPITLYFLLFSPKPRRNIRRYLQRAIGPQAGWGDGYRLLHAFASTVLDRVFFLRGRLALFDVGVRGEAHIVGQLAQGRGAFLVGAHMGSFEALSACRQLHRADAAGAAHVDQPMDLRLAMLMYPDNARRINAVLDAISMPACKPHLIALGRPAAMLELRDWLDAGRMAGMLADRSLAPAEAGASARGGTVMLPFLGRPAPFSDGPFRLAAMLRRPMVFMAGIYHGGARYELLFEPLADFSALPRDAAAREEAIQEALRAYVQRLESLCRAHPHNWFNFHDFWLEDPAS
ncbi:acyl-CoA synthetase [Xenophilus arseniciresistens]|uniref:Acyl-CoA synthetase n=1 Tax=Xenophilus arseniciresistens TaxID=1283306 RepID=A0AAE3T1Q0_9BURK|nr:acyl-CoA synthetase [Xenophilus arseniciresistens]MDA7418206.1 acyl-CoA synthetase [Xenophilus arseniciresistens]